MSHSPFSERLLVTLWLQDTLTLGELERAAAHFGEAFGGDEDEIEEMFTLDGRDTITPIGLEDLAKIIAHKDTGIVTKKKGPPTSRSASD